MARLRAEWRHVGLRLQAAVSAARLTYFIRRWGREVEAWAELRDDWGGARRIEVGSFRDVAAARAACEADARARLQREPDDAPVDVRIAQPRRRR